MGTLYGIKGAEGLICQTFYMDTNTPATIMHESYSHMYSSLTFWQSEVTIHGKFIY